MKSVSMKKIVLGILSIAMLAVALTACGASNMKIENYEWKMRTVMKNDSDLVVPAVDEADDAYPDAKVIDLTLTAKDGKIAITDATNNVKYEGTYTVEGKNLKGTDYKVTIDGKEGYATVAMTKYDDGSEEPTLPINLGDYSIYFYAE